ncbi:MAG UNVERIFIED_CONTAM: acyl-CoA thioesterase [Microcystis novacekii LVE1205-3]
MNVYAVNVQFGDCDPAGIVFFPNFNRWMDEASLAFFMSCGIPPWRELVKTRGIIGTPLLEIQTKFYRPATYGETIEIHTTVQSWAAKTLRQHHLRQARRHRAVRGHRGARLLHPRSGQPGAHQGHPRARGRPGRLHLACLSPAPCLPTHADPLSTIPEPPRQERPANPLQPEETSRHEAVPEAGRGSCRRHLAGHRRAGPRRHHRRQRAAHRPRAQGLGIPMSNGVKMRPAGAWPAEKLKVVILDDATDPTKGVQNVRRFVNEDKADLILGSGRERRWPSPWPTWPPRRRRCKLALSPHSGCPRAGTPGPSACRRATA